MRTFIVFLTTVFGASGQIHTLVEATTKEEAQKKAKLRFERLIQSISQYTIIEVIE